MFEVLETRLNQKRLKLGEGAVESHGYGLMRVNWPLEGHKVEGVHRVESAW